MLGMGGVSKIIGTEEMVGNFEFMKLSSYLMMVGVLEVLGVIMLLLPKTSLYGSVLIGSIMTGSMYALSLGFSGTEMPILLGVLGFTSYKLREL